MNSGATVADTTRPRGANAESEEEQQVHEASSRAAHTRQSRGHAGRLPRGRAHVGAARSTPGLTPPSGLRVFVSGLTFAAEEDVGRGGHEVAQDGVYESRARPPRRRVSIGQPEFEEPLLSPEGVDESTEGSGGKGVTEVGGISRSGGFWKDMWGGRAGRRRRAVPVKDHGVAHEAKGSEDDHEAMLASSGSQVEAGRAGRRRWAAPGKDHGAVNEAQGSEEDHEASIASSESQGEASRTVEDEVIFLQDEHWRQQQDYLQQSQQEPVLRRTRSSSSGRHGGNSLGRAVITFLKGMVGSYILFLPHLFARGGMLFTGVSMVALAIFSTYNIILLIRCRKRLGAEGVEVYSFGDIGSAALGRLGGAAVDASLFLSQLRYCITYLIFVAQNLRPLIKDRLPDDWSWLARTNSLIMLQACIQVPLSWVRRLEYLGPGMLAANVCIFSGLLLIVFAIGQRVADNGVADEDDGGISLFNPNDCLIVLGSVVGCFEGIGVVLPIQDRMEPKARDRLPEAFGWSMLGITTFFLLFSVMGHLAFGDEVSSFITMDLPRDSALGTIVPLLYCMGLMLSSPLELFPAVKVVERLLWPAAEHSKKAAVPHLRRKWLKNLLRTCMVALTVLVALVAGSRFDSFVGLAGGVCATPLSLIYPVLFEIQLYGHLSTTWETLLHRSLLVFGISAGIASTFVAIRDF